MKEWLTVKEAALAIDRAASNIYRWISNGTLPSEVGVDRIVRVHKNDLYKAEAANVRHGKKYTRVTSQSSEIHEKI